MARIRTIKPEFWQDERLGQLPMSVRMLFLGLVSMADDEGRMRGSPLLIRAQVFPYDLEVDVVAGLDQLESIGRIQRYQGEGEAFIWVRNFGKHQRINRSSPSCFPVPPEPSVSAHGGLSEDSLREGKGMEGKGKDQGMEGKAAQQPPPKTPPPQTQRPIPHGLTVSAPTTEPEDWTGDDLWRWAQTVRTESGLLPEKPPKNPLGGWFNSCRMTPGVTTAALMEGFYRFGQDKHWEAKDPPFPFAAFMAGWEKYTRPEVRHGTAA